ncbi:O-antigen ligase family protein [Parapedobacter sp. 10938]|uniref:O-antigen ligase family protein n=1 Tax=Parapedobacter flavus TaxID=3110225 RepID=UPI002DBAA06D|nr:O-antigen ligase family protein [Parapedobacter sp. 10938]MEC3881231.1 O-antigen ligase family protein [Parapedobacter sp. 10938]
MQVLKKIARGRPMLCELLFCVALLSVFLPVKIYPLVFLVATLFFALATQVWLQHRWSMALAVFAGYAIAVFLMGLPAERWQLTNFAKLVVNFTFMYVAVAWLAQRQNERLVGWVDITLHIALALTLLQLLAYHQAVDFRWVGGAATSAQGSALYQSGYYFWGLDDKNMFGARIALLGFVYVLLPTVRQHAIIWWRIVLVLLLAWLSLSRTPVVALFMGIGCLVWLAATVRWRVVLGVIVALAFPVVAQRVIRVENITASNDGMGVRLTYWKAFLEHFSTISPLGNGFLSGGDFLGRYADFYHGEPHIHNTFLSAYLDFGVVGIVSYVLFLYYYFRFCMRMHADRLFWWVAFIPLLAIMMILYSGYDNDIVLYLVLIFLLGSAGPVPVKQLKGRVA